MNSEWLLEAYDLSNQIIVITGGAGVLGSEMTRSLLDQGARVCVLTRDPDKKTHFDPSDRLMILKSDVTSREVLEENKLEIKKKFGTATGLINAAGGNQPGATCGADKSFFDLSSDALQQVFSLNLLGTILPSQVFAADMAELKRGNIINISSMAASQPLTRIPAYAASKAGVDNFTRWLSVHMAQEYSPDIRVNAIAPGFFLTEQNRFLLTDRESGNYTERGKSIVDHTPMARLGNPRDLVSTLLWLLSPASKFVTGVIVPVDGGFSSYSGV